MSTVDAVIALASREVGKPYVYGTEGPTTFDCSGLTQYVYGLTGIRLPRTAREQQNATTRVTTPLPGDLVFYGAPAHHVGIYIGGGRMIDAPDVGQRVRVDAVGTPTNYGRVAGAGALAAVPLGVITGAASTAADATSSLLGGARHIVLEAAFLTLGLGLVGWGIWRGTAGARSHLPTMSDLTGGLL